MPTSLLSSLSRGYGTWTGSIDTTLPKDDTLPSLDSGTCQHRHGVTVTPRVSSAHGAVPIAVDGQLDIPKTFLTRKGALMLFTAPDNMPEEPKSCQQIRRKRNRHKDVIDLSLKLRTIERLSLSVLQFGDKSYDKEASSITDKENQLVLSFLHELNEENDDCDLHSQPGGDLKFYLRDLKRRASCRGYGAGDASPHRARSAELQEILDDLEQAWPRYGGTHRGSMFAGSASSGEDFFHPSSPTPSVKSARSLSRSKVLSSKKLTASLKSMSYMGRAVSTEPEISGGILNENLRTSTEFRYGRSKSAASSLWHTPAASQDYLRPETSQTGRSSTLKMAVDRKLVTSPEPTEDEGVSEVGHHGYVVMVKMFGLKYQSDHHGSERGRSITPLKGERSYTPVRLGDSDAMFANEAASVLSSLVEEEDDMDVPLDNLSEEGEELEEETTQWPSGDQEGRKSVTSSRSKTPQKISAESPDTPDGFTQPLHPPYTGVMVKDQERKDTLSPDLQQRPGSRSASRADTHVDSRPGSTIPGEHVTSRVTTPSGLDGHSEQMIDQVSQMMSDGEKLRTSSALGAASVGSMDKPAADPDTLISLHKDELDVLKDRLVSGAFDTASKEATVVNPVQAELKETKPTPAPEINPLSVKIEVKPTIAAAPSKDETLVVETEKPQPETPKRRPKPQEIKTPRLDEEVDEPKPDDESKEEEENNGDKPPELSDRVKQELEEKEEKAAMLKEEKEKAEAQQREAEEKKQQTAEEKRLAAEERLRQKAEEKARLLEERKKQEEEAGPGIVEQSTLKPSPPTGKKGTSPRGKAGGKGGKSGKKGGNDTAGEDAGDKKYVKALDITSVQPEAGKDENGLDALAKLKAANAKDDLPVDKLKDFVASQTPRRKITVEKKEPEVPEHLKDMFNRRSNSQTQEDLEQEMGKIKVAVDNVLGGSVLQTEGAEGLSAEDFALAQEALMEKIKKAEEEIEDAVAPKPTAKKGAKTKQEETKEKKKAGGKKKKGATDENKRDLAKEREAIKEQQKLEKQRRLEEALALQQKISAKEDARKTKEAEAKRKAQELAERMESIRQEEEEIERAEQDAREQLAAVRKVQREEREARRKSELEKKKQDAIEKREKEKAMMEKARHQEQEMLDRIADAEMARRLRDEEEAKREEEEMEAQERFEAELKAAQKAAEEEEEKLRELERQAEEEAFQRILAEKEEAEERRWELEKQAWRMKEEEERIRQEMLEEERRLEEERLKHEEEEEARREQERERLRELQRLEEEAREKMRVELDKRRMWALQRREYNLKARANMDGLKQSQGITEPWTFSYFVRWPKESYQRPMGADPKKQKGPQRPKPKPAAGGGNGNSAGNAPSAVDVSAVPS